MQITKTKLSKTNIWRIMNNFTPFLRYINQTDFMPNNDFTIAYDCRMLYVIDGTGVLHTEYGDFELKPNTLAYYPSGIKYFPQSSMYSKLQFITVNFDFNDIHKNVTQTLPPVPCDEFLHVNEFPSYHCIDEDIFSKPFIIEDALFLRSNLVKLCDTYYSNSNYSVEISSTLLKLCILDILKYKTTSVSNQLVEDIKNYIVKNFNKINSNGDVAKAFKYHEYYLNNIFKKYVGTTIHKYIIDTRIKNAEEMLSYTNYSISDIATKCGFINPDHFSRLFKEKHGISPIRYRGLTRYI